MRTATFSPRRAAAQLTVFVLASAAQAQLTPIGLSEVRAQWILSQDLGGYSAEEHDQVPSALAAGDFNGDGAADLASGIHVDDLLAGACVDCGMVVVRYGTPGRGLANAPPPLVLHQALPGSPNPAEWADHFGESLAVGDFNGDGFDDLAVGVPYDGSVDAGGVQIYFGSAGGLQTTGSQFLTELTTSEPGHFCTLSRFGTSLATGDFDGDSFFDLAVGVPNGCETVEGAPVRAGSVFVAHGGAGGLVPFFGYRISQNSFGIFEESEAGDEFGRAVASGDFDHDGYGDLAIGVAAEGDHGAIEIIMGSNFGLIFADSAYWAPGALNEIPELGDRLGFALVSGDFDGDHFADLAIGNPREDLGSPVRESAGSLAVAFGSPAGFDLSRTRNIVQSTLYGPDEDEMGDQFGHALATGDFDGDGDDDLAVGHPGESSLAPAAGAATVLMGPALTERFRPIMAGYHGMPGDPEQLVVHFGSVLAAADFDATGFDDLAIGAPYYDQGPADDAGAELVLYGALFADGFEISTIDRWSSSGP